MFTLTIGHITTALITLISGIMIFKQKTTKKNDMLLDMGSIAFREILSQLQDKLNDIKSVKPEEIEQSKITDITKLTYTAYHAWEQSVAYNKGIVSQAYSQSLNSAILTTLKMTNVGSLEWFQIKSILDSFSNKLKSSKTQPPAKLN